MCSQQHATKEVKHEGLTWQRGEGICMKITAPPL